MNAILLLKKEFGMEKPVDHHGMENMVAICDCTLPKKEEGDEVEFSGKGTIVVRNGMRYILVEEVEGKPVEEHEMEEYSHEEEMDSNDALDSFMKQYKKKK